MKNIAVFFLLAAVLSCPVVSRSQVNTDSLHELVIRLGVELITQKQGVGLSIGICNQGNTHFYHFGTTRKGEASSPVNETVYEIGSITKTFVSYILARAVLEQKVNLEDDIRRYLKGNYPNLEYAGHPIRLVHLANTSSLLPDWLPELPAAWKGLPPDSALKLKTKMYAHMGRADFFNALHTVTLDTIPGTRRYHSNAAAQLLGYILEDIYGMPMDQLLEKFITIPYGLKNTAFISPGKTNHLATGYTASGQEAVYEYTMPYFQQAGGLGSSVSDLATYIGLLLDTRNPVAALCLTKTLDVDVSSGKVVPLRADSIAAPDVYSAALNWFRYQPDATSLQIWADGGTNGFNSYLVLYPQLNSGIVLLANKSDETIFRALPGMAYKISTALQ